jgi:hypothetical protein
VDAADPDHFLFWQDGDALRQYILGYRNNSLNIPIRRCCLRI